MVKDFDEYLVTLNSTTSLKKFNLSKLNASNEDERKQCVNALINFAIEYPACVEKLTKFIQNLMSFRIKNSDDQVVKDIPKFFTEICNEKLKIFANDDSKNWSEIESFGMFLAHLYGIKLLKTRVMHVWLDEMKKCAAESDEALKLFIKVFKIASEEMKKTNETKFTMYLSNLEEFNEKDASRISNNCRKWMNKEKGVTMQPKVVESASSTNPNEPILKPTDENDESFAISPKTLCSEENNEDTQGASTSSVTSTQNDEKSVDELR